MCLNKYIPYVLMISMFVLLFSCASPQSHMRDINKANEDADRISVGKVQREIRVGMASAEVIEVLGSPNMVTTDEKRREVWVYDKVSTTSVYSSSEGGVYVLLLGAGGATGARSTTQRTLTIVIKFTEDGKVRDFAYHSSQF